MTFLKQPPSFASDTFSSMNQFIENSGLAGLSVVLTGIILALVVHRLGFKVLVKLTIRTRASKWLRILRESRPIIRLALIVFALDITLPLVAMPELIRVTLTRLTTLSLIAITGWLVYKVMSAAMELYLSRHRIDVEDNLEARKMRTRLRVLRQALSILICLVTVAAMLMVFPNVRSIGVSIFASAGVAGIVVGFAARPVLSNLLAGIQIALTQPIRIDDAVVIEGEWGWIEEITATYVVVKIWDWRRLVVPLSHVIEKPFQNWTRETAAIIGNVTWHTDYTVPVEHMRTKLKQFLEASTHWDGDVQVLQVIDSGPETMTLRALMSARNSPTAWDLRCEVREKMINWLQAEYPASLPRRRGELAIESNTM